MTMLIHEVVTFSCYLVSNVKYIKKKKNHILFIEWQPARMGYGIVLLDCDRFFFFLLILNSKVS